MKNTIRPVLHPILPEKARFLQIAFLFAAILLMSFPQAQAGKIYKWVDENGKTHFSTVRPENQDAKNIKNDLSNSGGGGISATVRGNYAYCDNYELPGPLSEPAKLVGRVQQRLPEWRSRHAEYLQEYREALREKREQENKKLYSGGRGYDYSIRNAQEKVNYKKKYVDRYNCIISWGERQVAAYDKSMKEAETKVKNMETQQQALVRELREACGDRPRSPANPQADKQWLDCRERYNLKIKHTKKEQHDIKKEIDSMK